MHFIHHNNNHNDYLVFTFIIHPERKDEKEYVNREGEYIVSFSNAVGTPE